jgi:mono/diheme cytochrome c family protein
MVAGGHAPSLRDPDEGAVGPRGIARTVAWFGTGLNRSAVATGQMARVVVGSLQHLSDADLRAMATDLAAPRAVPGVAPPANPAVSASASASASTSASTSTSTSASAPSPRSSTLPPPAGDATLALGAALYREHCADCHGADVEGVPPPLPVLAGNRTLTMASPVNAIRGVLHGGFSPGTRDNPRPWSMPPHGPRLVDGETARPRDRETAALVSWRRQAWGHRAAPVAVREVAPLRPVPVD